MKAHTPSGPEVQAQTGSPARPPGDPPLSFSHRPDVGRRGPDPLEYDHRYACLRDYAQLLALRYDQNRTRHAYYRQLRLLSDHFDCDPATLSESQVRDYFLHVKTIVSVKGSAFYSAGCGRLRWEDERRKQSPPRSPRSNRPGEGCGGQGLPPKRSRTQVLCTGTRDSPRSTALLGLPEGSGSEAQGDDQGAAKRSTRPISRGQARGWFGIDRELGGGGQLGRGRECAV
jgi:hypothetical protein